MVDTRRPVGAARLIGEMRSPTLANKARGLPRRAKLVDGRAARRIARGRRFEESTLSRIPAVYERHAGDGTGLPPRLAT